MRHDWVFEVLTDLRSYSERNGFVRLADQLDVTLAVARDELGDDGPDGLMPDDVPD
jgi:predicted transcriptional regulator